MRIALVQHNPTIGDIDGNLARIVELLDQALKAGAGLAVLPEQALIGYPAKDLLWRAEVTQRNVEALAVLAETYTQLGLIVGYAEPNDSAVGRPVYNSAALLDGGQLVAKWRKQLLPVYDVFDEIRYFEPAIEPQPVADFHDLKLGVAICEDLLSDDLFGRPLYASDPPSALVEARAQVLLVPSASPFVVNKHARRRARCAEVARRLGVPVLLCNQVGGNDEIVFDGASCAFDAHGQCIGQARSFAEDVLIVEIDVAGGHAPAGARAADRSPAGRQCHNGRQEPVPADVACLHDALVLGLRDYVRKCGFRSVVLGLSGGIDSAVTAALAVAALGAENVRGVAMPSRYSSPHSVADAQQLADNLGVHLQRIDIEPMHAAFEQTLTPHFNGRPPDVTEENIQARIRGATLMALSNKFGCMLLTTGNKSELAVGYCTLYGDMAGGLAVISDVPKTSVYALARHINQRAARALIPQRTIDKPPSAELRPDQHDQQALPPYEVLDAILERYDERLQTPEQIIAAGFEPAIVRRVVRMIQASEYKRQQAAPGLKVTSRAFGFGRRMPIAARLATDPRPSGRGARSEPRP